MVEQMIRRSRAGGKKCALAQKDRHSAPPWWAVESRSMGRRPRSETSCPRRGLVLKIAPPVESKAALLKASRARHGYGRADEKAARISIYNASMIAQTRDQLCAVSRRRTFAGQCPNATRFIHIEADAQNMFFLS